MKEQALIERSMSRGTDVVYVSPCAKEAGRRSLPPSRDAMLLPCRPLITRLIVYQYTRIS
jgi:hypothetical protein